MAASNPEFDVVIYGATSFVGEIITEYMLAFTADRPEIRWAVAGRNQQKLDSLLTKLGAEAGRVPVIIANANDSASLSAMCTQAKVVMSTVGPYALYGEPLVAACADSGTDYVDLTGETQWIAAMVEKYQDKAAESGARIVHCCGFDSIPSDLGVMFHQQHAQQKHGRFSQRIRMRVKALRGGMSGGTVASIINIVKAAKKDKQLRRKLANPYLLCAPNHGFTARQSYVGKAEYDKNSGRWAAPFVMAAINTRIVHRSHSLMAEKYHPEFQYDEAMLMKSKGKAKQMAWGLNMFTLGAAVGPLRWLMSKFLPKPGQGPSKHEQEHGFFDLRFYGEASDGQVVETRVTGDRDPGYGSTAKMISQAALCLAQDIGKDDLAGGIWTPSTAMGNTLLKRLEAHAGLTFDLL